MNYTNTLPFRWALKNSPLIQGIDLQEDIPSICAQKLRFRQVSLALVPVALLPELEQYFIETHYCIGASGAVDSVKLYSDVPLEQITDITLDYQSKSSITLTRVLAKFFWNIDVTYTDAKPGYEKNVKGSSANVVIGDRTFELNGKFRYEYDLALEWQKFTGLPFVFAAWVSTEKLDPQFISSFNAVLEHGVERIHEAVEEYSDQLKITKAEAVHYLKDRISYPLDDNKKRGLQLFLQYISRL